MSSKKLAVIGLVALLALFVASSVLAAPPELSGTIVSVHKGAHTIVVKTDQGRETVYYSSTTQISDDGKSASADDLKAGESVKVAYLEESGSKVAIRVEVTKA